MDLIYLIFLILISTLFGFFFPTDLFYLLFLVSISIFSSYFFVKTLKYPKKAIVWVGVSAAIFALIIFVLMMFFTNKSFIYYSLFFPIVIFIISYLISRIFIKKNKIETKIKTTVIKEIFKVRKWKIILFFGFIILFIITNFLWTHRIFGRSMATKFDGLGLPFLYRYEICGDVIINSKAACNKIFDPWILVRNMIIWITMYFNFIYIVFLIKKLRKFLFIR